VAGRPIAGADVVVGHQAVRSVGQRLLDAADPAIIEQIAKVVVTVAGGVSVTAVRARRVGHRLPPRVRLRVDGTMQVTDAHAMAEALHHEHLHHAPCGSGSSPN